MKKEFLILAMLCCVFGMMVSVSAVSASPFPQGAVWKDVSFNEYKQVLTYPTGRVGYTIKTPGSDCIKPVWKDSTVHGSYHVQITIEYFLIGSYNTESVQDNFNVDRSQRGEVTGNELFAPKVDKTRPCTVTVTTWDI
jgi:hypothetical protein